VRLCELRTACAVCGAASQRASGAARLAGEGGVGAGWRGGAWWRLAPARAGGCVGTCVVAALVGHGDCGGRFAGCGRTVFGTRPRGRRPIVSMPRLEPPGRLPSPDGGHLSRACAGSCAAGLMASGGPQRVGEGGGGGGGGGSTCIAGASHPRELSGESTSVAARSLSVTVAAAAVAAGAA